MKKESPNNLNIQLPLTPGQPIPYGFPACIPNNIEPRSRNSFNDVLFVDQMGNPLANVNFYSVNNPSDGVTTGVDGMAALPDLPDSTMMRASYVGKKSVTKTLYEFTGGMITLQDEIGELDPVIITTPPPPTNTSTTTPSIPVVDNTQKYLKWALIAIAAIGVSTIVFGSSNSSDTQGLNGYKKSKKSKKKSKSRKKRTVTI
jgi:hypothetical protein